MRRLLFLILVCALAVPSEARRKRAVSKPTALSQLAPADARRLSYFYQAGIKQKLASNLSEAYDLFQHCLAIDPNNPDALYEAGYLKFYLGQDSLGTAMLQRVTELDDKNPNYLQALAAALLAQNRYDEAIPVVEHLSQLQKRRSDVLYQLMELYKANGKTDEAIQALDRIELLEGRTLQTSMQKYALYVDKGEQQQAYDVLKNLQQESPYDLRVPIILGRQYLENDDPEQAIEYFDIVAQADPQNADLRMAMMEYYAKTGQTDLRQAMRDSLLYAPNVPDEVRAQMAALLIDDLKGQPDQHQRIMATMDSLVALSNTPLIHSLRVSYMAYAKVDEPALAQALRDLLVVDPTNKDALSRLMIYYLRNRDMENTVEICRMGINAHPENLSYYYYLGVSQSQLKQTEQAIETLQSGLKQVDAESSSDYVSDIYEILGELYHEQGRVEEAFAAYDSCLVYKDDHAACLNNYAYYLSLRNERLDEAERMAYRATKLEPLNKTYLDTYAWVLFMQQNYVMAKFYIDRVVSPSQADSILLADETMHADVLEHAGDIYAHTGNDDLALRYWSLALKKGSDSAVLGKKLKLKKYVKE